MKSISFSTPGGPEVLTLIEREDPVPQHGEVLIDVAAAGVNRADINQRQGNYPSPPGAPEGIGMEVSGIISGLGAGVTGWAIGDRVCALLGGGGYSTKVVVPAAHMLPVPASVDLVDAAGLPEVVATVWSNVFMMGGLRAGETLLVHGGSSGIGTMAIQLATALGSLVAVTAGSDAKLAACAGLGAEILVNYKTEDYVEKILAETEGRGVDVILDAVGGSYVEGNLKVLAPHGRLLLIGNQVGGSGKLNVGMMTGKWLTVRGSTLRRRTVEEKSEIVASVRENIWPLVESGQIVPIIDQRIPLAEATRAHERMESSEHIGKLLLVTGTE